MAETRKEQFLYPYDLIEELRDKLWTFLESSDNVEWYAEPPRTDADLIDELIEWICKEHLLKYKEIYEPNWIRCEDRLPEDGTTVFFQVYEEEWTDTDGYVIDENTHVELGEFCRYRNGGYAFKYTDAISECVISNHNPHENVVAWQPVVIPEPLEM